MDALIRLCNLILDEFLIQKAHLLGELFYKKLMGLSFFIKDSTMMILKTKDMKNDKL